MAISTVSTIVLAVLVTPAIYILMSIFNYIRNTYAIIKAVKQWPGEPVHWLYGNMHQHPMAKLNSDNRDVIGNDMMKWYIDMLEKFPRGFTLFASPFHPSLQANHPEMVKTILKRGDPKPLSGAGYQLFLPWLGEGLVISKGKKWARNRRLLTPAFHFEILRPYMRIYHEATKVLLDKMRACAESGESFEVTKNVSLCTLDILLQCALSYKTDCQVYGDAHGGEEHPYNEAVKRMSIELLERFFNPLLYNNYVYLNLTSRGRRHKKDCDYVHKVAEDIINRRRQEISDNAESAKKTKHLDFLDILISARDDEGEGLTDVEIRNEVDTFMFAGHDTTGSSLTWILYALAKSPQHQRKVQEELDEIFQEKDNDVIEWEDLPKLKYLTMCIKESLRKYPPATDVSRVLEKDVEVDGRIIKAGTQVDVEIYSIHHHPDFWEKPQEFDPDRFLPENTAKRHPFAYAPFSAGPRNCIGQNFALNEEKVILAQILRYFDAELDPDHEVNFGLESTLKSSTDVKLKLKLRKL